MKPKAALRWLSIWACLLLVGLGCACTSRSDQRSPGFARQANPDQLEILPVTPSATRQLSTHTAVPSQPPTATVTPYATQTPLPTATSTHTPLPSPAVLIGAGDISVCGMHDDVRTAALLGELIEEYPEAEIFTAGDNVQINGDAFEYIECFGPTWGRYKKRIHPSPGNHDYHAAQGRAYYDYFGEAAGPDGLGFYSYELGDWHIVSLNSNCTGEDCGENSWQVQWLRLDLANNPRKCTLMYWHHPVWDSGTVPVEEAGRPFWQIAVDYGVDVVVNGHDHHYERFAPMDYAGNIDIEHGTREFIVGTGGAWLFELGQPLPATEVRSNETFGVMRFLLYPDHYSWTFFPVKGGEFYDAGVDVCR